MAILDFFSKIRSSMPTLARFNYGKKKPPILPVPGMFPAVPNPAQYSQTAGPQINPNPIIPQVKPAVTIPISSVAQKSAVNSVLPQITPIITPPTPTPTPQLTQGTPQGTSQGVPGATFASLPPQVSPEALKALDLAKSAYENSQKISPEELSTQEDIDKLVEEAGKIEQSRRLGVQTTAEQPIAMEFITGQQRSIENRALNQIYGVVAKSEPLERKLARLQSARTSSLEASKFALERADKTVAMEREEAESARRFGITTGLTEKSQSQQKIEADRKFEEDKRQFGLDYAIKQREIDIKESESAKTGDRSSYRAERVGRIIGSVDELMPRVNNKTVGFGSYSSFIRGTEAYNFKADLETLRANISFSELQAMREASKTGGALGQVAVRELELLNQHLARLIKVKVQKISPKICKKSEIVFLVGKTRKIPQNSRLLSQHTAGLRRVD